MKTILTILAICAASPSLACNGPTTASVNGSYGHIDLLTGPCATSVDVFGDHTRMFLDTTAAQGQTSMYTIMNQSGLAVRNQGGDLTLFAGSCPPGMSHAPVDNRSMSRRAAVLRCQ